MIVVQCKECDARHKVPPSMEGRKVHCTCGKELTISSEGERAEDASGRDVASEGEKWYCYVDGTMYGPYTPEKVRNLIEERRIGAKTRVRRKGKGRWELLSSVQKFSDFTEKLRGDSSSQSSDSSEKQKKKGDVWYYMRDGSRYGPLSLEKLLESVEKGDVRGADRVWSQELGKWKKVSEVSQLRKAIKKAEGDQEGELWYYRYRGEVRGPVSLHKLKSLINQARLRSGHSVYNKNLGEWTDVRDVPKLQEAVEAARRGEVEVKDESAVWFYYKEGKERGPVMLQSLAKRFASGKLDADTKVYGPGCDSWQRAGNVPQLSPYIVAKQEQTRDESATDMVDVRRDKKTARKSLKRKIVPLVTGGVVAMLLIAFLVVYQMESSDSATNGPVVEGPTVEVPPRPRAAVKKWLEIFLMNKEEMSKAERRARLGKLRHFYPTHQNRMDVYADDVRSSLQGLVESGGMENLSLEKVSRRVLRAEDQESFCYHCPFEKSETSVLKPVPGDDDSPARLQKVMHGDDFRVVRVYRLLYDGKPVHPSGYVLLLHSEGGESNSPWRIVGMGRVAHVGAQWKGRRVSYVTGYKASSMKESASFLQVGVDEATGKAARDDQDETNGFRLTESPGQNHQAIGEVMSVDANLVPPEVTERRAIVMSEGLTYDRLLITTETVDSQDMEEIKAKYGPPAEEGELNLSSSGVLSLEPSGEEGMGLYSDVKTHVYGNFSVATDPISGGIAGFVYHKEGF